MTEVALTVEPGGSAVARRLLLRYFEELDRRFPGGFAYGDALDEAAAGFDPPHGLFVVARHPGGEAVGCGALQHVDDVTSEVKRMWVSPPARGTGVASLVLARLEAEARAAGRSRVVLDTNESLPEALCLYAARGYVATSRYNDNVYATHWFEKSLDPVE